MAYSPLQLAEAYIKAGELDDALAALNEHLEHNPDDDNGRRLRAEVLLRLNTSDHLDQAQHDLEAITTREPSDYFMLAVILEKTVQLDQAGTALEQGCDQYPQDQRLRERLLHHYFKTENYTSAANLVSSILETHPDDWRWYQWSGDVHRQTGHIQQAIAQYQQAITLLEGTYNLDPSAPARVMQNALNDASALTISGSYARLHVAMAEVLAADRQFQEADNWYHKAAILLPDDPVILFKRGIIAARQQRPEDAKQLCQQALDRMPNGLRETSTNSLRDDPDLAALLAELQ